MFPMKTVLGGGGGLLICFYYFGARTARLDLSGCLRAATHTSAGHTRTAFALGWWRKVERSPARASGGHRGPSARPEINASSRRPCTSPRNRPCAYLANKTNSAISLHPGPRRQPGLFLGCGPLGAPPQADHMTGPT